MDAHSAVIDPLVDTVRIRTVQRKGKKNSLRKQSQSEMAIKMMSIIGFGHFTCTNTELHMLHRLNPRCRKLRVLVSETGEILDQFQSLTLRSAMNTCAPEQNDVSDGDNLHLHENGCESFETL